MKKILHTLSRLSPERVSWTFLWIMTAVIFFRPVETGDIWWHLKAGQYISQAQTVPLLDPFPVAEEKTVWILTQWLGSLFYFLVYQTGGLTGLKIIRVLIVLFALGQFHRFAVRRGLGPWGPFAGFLLMLAVAGRPHLRPFLFNVVFIQVFMGSLLHFWRTSRWRDLLPVVLAAPLWVNMHMGSFIYGFALIGLFLLAAAVDGWKKGAGSRVPGLALLGVLYAAIFFLNPYGIHGALHPLKTLFVPDYLNFGLIRDAISELQPPHLFSWTYAWVLPLTALGGLTLILDPERRFRNVLLIACGFFLFLYGQRAAVFFAVVTVYCLADAWDRRPPDTFPGGKTGRWFGHGLLAAVALMMTVGHFQQKVFWNEHGYRYLRMAEAPTSPKVIADKLTFDEVEGVVFADDNYGSYLLWNTYPRIRSFSDTRQINVPNFQLYNLVLHNPPRYWAHADLLNRFQAVILSADRALNWRLIRYLQQHPEWSLTSVHGDQIVFRRNRKKTLDAYVRALRAQDQHLAQYRQQLAAIVSAGPKHPVPFVRMEPADSAMTLYELGFPGAALERLVSSFEVSNAPYQHRIARLILENLSRR